MKKSVRIITSGTLALTLYSSAQNSVRIPDPMSTLTGAEKNSLDQQANRFFEATKPAVASASLSTVSINHRNQRLAFGTAISQDGKILTKWSEIAPASHRLVITTPDGKKHAAIVTGIYPDHDLAILKSDAKLTPVRWAETKAPDLGEFIALANPLGEAQGLGVVSVQSRSLREKDKAYLGVLMDFSGAGKNGISLKEVIPGSAAANAGLKNGDVVISIGDSKVQGAIEMKNTLLRLVPGSEVPLRYRRGNKEHQTKVLLGSRADNENIKRVPRARMSKMQKMGATPSKVRDNFPHVIQSDMPILPNDTGAPVVDLDGNVIGISIARGSRIKTFIIPSQTVLEVLASKPSPYTRDLASNIRNRNQTSRVPSRIRGNGADHTVDSIQNALKLLEEIMRDNQSSRERAKKIEDTLRQLQEQQSDRR